MKSSIVYLSTEKCTFCYVYYYKIGICYFFAKQAAVKRTSKDWLARNLNNVSKWSDMSTSGLLFQ